MIFNFNMSFTDGEWKSIIIEYLRVWTSIPLTTNGGYDIEDLKFFDGLLGTLLKHTEYLLKEYPSYLDKEFVDSWKYQGKLYRVIHPNYVFDNDSIEPHTVMPEVNYHGMITHWTSDYTFEGLLATAKIFDDEEYIILEADTGDHLAFDVNKFRQVNNVQEIYTQDENEIIFPMYQDNTQEYRMTIKEFIEKKQEEIL
jgi:hypothetical protein